MLAIKHISRRLWTDRHGRPCISHLHGIQAYIKAKMISTIQHNDHALIRGTYFYGRRAQHTALLPRNAARGSATVLNPRFWRNWAPWTPRSRPQKERATKEHPDHRSGVRNGDSRIKLLQLRKENGSRRRLKTKVDEEKRSVAYAPLEATSQGRFENASFNQEQAVGGRPPRYAPAPPHSVGAEAPSAAEHTAT